jgi:acid stress-induced BolA-like protein IbaG/YrbA
VAIVARGLVDQGKIKEGVLRAERALAPDVIRIMYSYSLDVTGDQSLFFRVVISDQAAAPTRLRETTQRIIAKVMAEIESQELGLETYFNFRSRSEQAMLRDPFWERP